jgi:hypothetical protein
MKEEHGRNIFVGGCPVCKELCCCTNKTTSCKRLNHCYRKCPATKVARKPNEKRDGDNSFSIGKNGAFNEDDTEGLTNTSMILGRKRSAMEISPDCYADDILNSIYVSPALENNILSSYGNCSGDISRLKIPSLIGSSETGVIPGLLGSRSNTALPSILSHQAFAMLPQTCVFLWADDHSRLPTQTILSTVADSSALEIASRESDCNIASLVMDSTTNLE